MTSSRPHDSLQSLYCYAGGSTDVTCRYEDSHTLMSMAFRLLATPVDLSVIVLALMPE